jgi:hypothetical protein
MEVLVSMVEAMDGIETVDSGAEDAGKTESAPDRGLEPHVGWLRRQQRGVGGG